MVPVFKNVGQTCSMFENYNPVSLFMVRKSLKNL